MKNPKVISMQKAVAPQAAVKIVQPLRYKINFDKVKTVSDICNILQGLDIIIDKPVDIIKPYLMPEK
jgi:hypothetical protein